MAAQSTLIDFKLAPRRQFAMPIGASWRPLDPYVPVHDYRTQHQHDRCVQRPGCWDGVKALALVGGVKHDLVTGLSQNLSDWLRRMVQARSVAQRIGRRKAASIDIRLSFEVKNRVTGRSMGEHTEDMARTWKIGQWSRMNCAERKGSRRRIAASSRI